MPIEVTTWEWIIGWLGAIPWWAWTIIGVLVTIVALLGLAICGWMRIISGYDAYYGEDY